MYFKQGSVLLPVVLLAPLVFSGVAQLWTELVWGILWSMVRCPLLVFLVVMLLVVVTIPRCFESLAQKILLGSNSVIAVGIYRPPSAD